MEGTGRWDGDVLGQDLRAEEQKAQGRHHSGVPRYGDSKTPRTLQDSGTDHAELLVALHPSGYPKVH